MYGRLQSRRTALAAVAAAGLVAAVTGAASVPAMAQGQPVKIGELNSYSRFAAFAVPYRNGMQLAQDEINAKIKTLPINIEIPTRMPMMAPARSPSSLL